MAGLHLCQTAYDNDIEGVKAILRKKRVNCNYRDESEWTPLMNAAYAGAPRVIELLLQRDDIDVNASDNSGTTALMNAALCGDIRCVKLLLKRSDMDVRAKDNSGKTALDFAKERGVEEVIRKIKNAQSIGGQAKKLARRISSRFSLAR